jgi:sterol desaturase/sphingolipid hydroxylase (fatty acid hydroxylase superfamily)
MNLETEAIAVVLLTWLNLVFGIYLAYRQEVPKGERGVRGFLGYAFPWRLIFHPSTRLDGVFVVVQKLAFPFLVGPAIAALYTIGTLTERLAEQWLGLASPPQGSAWWASLIFSIMGATLAADFGDFWTHRLLHRVAWLWEFHKVHHSAEVMAYGLTGRRNHPVEDIIRMGSAVIGSGVVLGLFAYGFGLPVENVTLYGIDVYLLVKLLGFYHLKHGHAHLRFGPVLERVIVSPAQHQLHHSRDPRHYDSNYGTLISVWDLLYGTWRRSDERGDFPLGLQDDEHLEYNSVLKLYYLPFVKIWRRICGARGSDDLVEEASV